MNEVQNEEKTQVRPSFSACLKKAEAQLKINSFGYRDRLLAMELCKMTAEVYLFAGTGHKGGIRVDGELVPYGIASEVFETLGPEHLEYVIGDYQSRTYMVRNPKAYLRASLYNAAFKMELSQENEFRRNF